MQPFVISLLGFFVALYLVKAILFVFGYFRAMRNGGHPPDSPGISVVVASRNEENNIAGTLDSLVALDYPKDKMEIIVSDGASEDRTCEIVMSYALKYPFVRLLHADQNRSIRGKANAIHQAVELAKGEFILMTDADCLVPPTWAKETVKYFTKETGLVCGITIPEADGAFAAVQTVDWAYILGTSSSVASLGFPIGGIGNNFNFRKKAYEDIGGYENLSFSVTEDYSLFRAIAASPWKIAFPLRYETCIKTNPMMTLREHYQQKKRWTLGGLDANPLQSFLALLIFLVHVLTLAGIFLLPLNEALLGVGIKTLADFLVVFPVLKQLRKLRLIWAFPLFELFYYTYVLLVPLILLFGRKVVWKGVSYEVIPAKGGS